MAELNNTPLMDMTSIAPPTAKRVCSPNSLCVGKGFIRKITYGISGSEYKIFHIIDMIISLFDNFLVSNKLV